MHFFTQIKSGKKRGTVQVKPLYFLIIPTSPYGVQNLKKISIPGFCLIDNQPTKQTNKQTSKVHLPENVQKTSLNGRTRTIHQCISHTFDS